jgi:hypothetical protein
MKQFLFDHWLFIAEGVQTFLLLYLVFFKKFKQTVKLGGGVKMKKVSSYALKSKNIAKERGILR